MPHVTDEKVVEIIQLANAALTRATQLEEKAATARKRIEELAPAVVKALIDGQRIEKGAADAVTKILYNPAQVLDLLAKVARHRNADEVSRLGNGFTEKTSSENGRSSTASKAGERLLERLLGGRV